MSTIVGVRRLVVVGLALLGLACGDASTAPGGDEIFVVSLTGVAADDAGIVLRLTGGVELASPAYPSLDVAWAHDDAGATTVAILGPLSQTADVLVVRAHANKGPLRVQLVEVASANGAVSLPLSARALVRSRRGD